VTVTAKFPNERLDVAVACFVDRAIGRVQYAARTSVAEDQMRALIASPDDPTGTLLGRREQPEAFAPLDVLESFSYVESGGHHLHPIHPTSETALGDTAADEGDVGVSQPASGIFQAVLAVAREGVSDGEENECDEFHEISLALVTEGYPCARYLSK